MAVDFKKDLRELETQIRTTESEISELRAEYKKLYLESNRVWEDYQYSIEKRKESDNQDVPSDKENRYGREYDEISLRMDEIESKILEKEQRLKIYKNGYSKMEQEINNQGELQSNSYLMAEYKYRYETTTDPEEKEELRLKIDALDRRNSHVAAVDKNNRTMVETPTNTVVLNNISDENNIKNAQNKLDMEIQNRDDIKRNLDKMIADGDINSDEYEKAKAALIESEEKIASYKAEKNEAEADMREGDTDDTDVESTDLVPDDSFPTDENVVVQARPYVEPDKRIKLRPMNRSVYQASNIDSVLHILNETDGVIFPYTPDISFETSVNYSTMDVTHANQDFYFYNHTPATKINITGTFTAQNKRDAEYMFAVYHFFRAITKMRFGSDGNGGLDERRGAPPPMLLLSGYGELMMNDLPVIVTSFNMPFPSDVDYVEVEISGIKVWVPSVTTLSVSLVVQNTPKKLREFNWDDFANGKLLDSKGWF